ncbi:hypothetical protein H6504_05620 [Candidatus Woesearchaeota archaeon]|nr:hypothetical protein [Candidatus Woesearchaeota archaeon]
MATKKEEQHIQMFAKIALGFFVVLIVLGFFMQLDVGVYYLAVAAVSLLLIVTWSALLESKVEMK